MWVIFLGKCDGAYRCVEAKGINYGTICSNVTDNDWQYGLHFSVGKLRYGELQVGYHDRKIQYYTKR